MCVLLLLNDIDIEMVAKNNGERIIKKLWYRGGVKRFGVLD